jgi:hypothetical protein
MNKPNKKPVRRRWQAKQTLKMEATCSFEMSVEFQRSTRRYIPEDRNLQRSRYFALRMYAVLLDITNDSFNGSDCAVSIGTTTSE